MSAFFPRSIRIAIFAFALPTISPAPVEARDDVVAGLAAGALAGVAAGAILSAPGMGSYYAPAPAYYPPPPAYYGPPCFIEDRQVWDPNRGYVYVRERVCE
jgi:hypothetical protein